MSTVKFMMGLITPTVISGGIKKTVKVHRISPAHTSRVFTKLYFTFCRLYYRSAEFILHGHMHPLKVSVEIKDGKIASVTVTEHQETDGVADPALEQIPAAIVEKNSTDVDVVSGATLTSNGIIEAVNNALEQAK